MLVDDHWRQYGPGAAGVGWDIALANLATFLTGAPVEAEESWTATPDGQRFMTLAGDRWADADRAAGTDPETAATRATDTIAFYTGAKTAG